MILRSLTTHVKTQNWFAVGLDFFIVVVGVYIGIQVSNWNEARVDQQRAQGYLERINADLSADITSINNLSEFWRQTADYGEVGLNYANTGDAGQFSQWQLLLAYFQASQVAELYLAQSTFDELKSAGELRLISDLSLRADLAQYYLFPASATVNQRPPYRENVRGVIPVDLQNYIWDACYAADERDKQQMLPCTSPVEEVTVAAVVNLISSDVALMKELRYWMSSRHVADIIAQNKLELAGQIQREVLQQIGKVPENASP